MRALRTRRSILVGAALVLGACGPAGQPKFRLEGSLGQLMNFAYDEARLRLDYDPGNPQPTDTLSIEFIKRRSTSEEGMNEDTVLKIGYVLAGDAPPANQRLDLTFLDENGQPRTTLSRNVLNDPRRTFPPLRVGSLFLDRAPDRVKMNTVNGDFNLTFQNGAEVASGRTIFGNFSAKVIPP